MPKHTQYRLPRARKARRSRFLWLLLLVGLVVAGWIWWHSGQPAAPAPKPKTIAAAPTTQAVVQPKPPPTQGVAPLKLEPKTIQPPATPPPVPIPAPPTIAKPSPELLPPGVFPRPVQSVFEAQLALARQGISSGSLDGRIGSQTRAALRAFQQKEHLATTGELDAASVREHYSRHTSPAYASARGGPGK